MKNRGNRTERAKLSSRSNRVRPIYPAPTVLYRHILRQAKALPDPASRYFFQTQARRQFRTPIRDTPIDQRLNKAMHSLIKLTHANIGHSAGLEYVIGLTYGFVGPVIKERAKVSAI